MKEKTRNQGRTIRNSRGFTLLLAALVASVALTLGSSIYEIVSKELALSSIGQNSQYAFYAADTAAECVLYWDDRVDKHPNTFATSTDSTGPFAPAASILCDGQSAPVTIQSHSSTAATSLVGPSGGGTLGFDLFTDVSSGYCANVIVAKTKDPSTGAVDTVITANGYSVSCANVQTSPSALQRTVQLLEK
ncbi:MAG TPA: hypothetical protein VMH91_01875 [Candidatus Paceibacterota bacterium]|nr:hypothetical protein [Candidatus Paceibacterota bacterium]